jgi:hypothetical protein
MKPRLIGLTGKMESGKSTAAAYLREKYGYRGTALTDPMDEMLRPLLLRMKVPEEEISRRLSGDMKNTPIPGWEWLTGRKLKQAIGREFRDVVSRPNDNGGTDKGLFHDLWIEENEENQYKIHEQIRYDFEADLIRRDGGIVIEIYDPNHQGTDEHESEQINFPVDYRIENTKDGYDAFYAKIDDFMAWEPDEIEIYLNKVDCILAKDRDTREGLQEILERSYRISDEVEACLDEIIGHFSALKANQVSEEDADETIDMTEKKLIESIRNVSNERMLAACFAFYGKENFIRKIKGPEKVLKFKIAFDYFMAESSGWALDLEQIVGNSDIYGLLEEANSGDAIMGPVNIEKTTEVPLNRLTEELKQIDNDGTFFDVNLEIDR